MSSLLKLPNELLAEIITHLKPPSRSPFAVPCPWSRSPLRHAAIPTSLLVLCQTCRLLREIAQCFIFESVYSSYLEAAEDTSLLRFQHTFELRPQLTKAVKELAFYNPCFPSGEEELDRMRRLSKLLELLQSVLANLSCVQILHLLGGRFKATTVPSGSQDRVARQDTLGLTVPLPACLRSLYINPTSEDDDLVNLAEYSEFFVHPTLSTISIQSCAASCRVDDWKLNSVFHLRPNTLSITALDLLQCHIDQESLRTIMEACKVLKTFRFQAFDRTDACSAHRLTLGGALARPEPLLPKEFISALETREDTLETLCVDFRGSFGDGNDIDLTMEGMHAFQHLTRLSMESHRLQGFHHLPRLVEHITLTQCVLEDLERQCNAIINSKQTHTLNLRSARLETIPSFGETWDKNEIIAQARLLGTQAQCARDGKECCLKWTSHGVDFVCSNIWADHTRHRSWRDGCNEVD